MNVIEMEGFLRGKCMPRDILVNESTAEYLVRKLNEATALKAERDALAVENAELKNFCKNAAFDADYESELCMERGGFTDAFNNIETPATDAALATVRLKSKIEGVEAAANRVGIVSLQYKPGQKQELIKAIGRDVLQYAAELREAK